MIIPFLLTLASAAAPQPSMAPARFAIIIGYNGGAPDERPALSYADDDAARMFGILAPGVRKAWLLSTFDKESARVHVDLVEVARPPTKTSLAQVLGEVSWAIRQQTKAGVPTELFFYFAGHGDVTDAGEGFVVLQDGSFTRSDLETQVIEASPADVNHVVIDACASYFMVSSRGDSSSAVALSPELLDVVAPSSSTSAAARAKTGVFVSTSSAAEVHESASLGSGVFSYLFRSALVGAGDADGDGRIEYSEAAAFVAAASDTVDDPRARLRVHAVAPLQRPHAPLQDLARSGATRFLVVDSDDATHLRVLDAHGTPYVELFKERGATTTIALVGAPFFVVQRGAREAVLVPRRAGAYALSALAFEDAPRARGEARGPFARLFAAPFGLGFLRGYLPASGLPPPVMGAPLVVPWAQGAQPPFRFPWTATALGALAGAGVFGAAASVAVVGNLAAFSTLERTFDETGRIDPAASFEVEAWRTAATGLTVGAVGLGVAAAALWFAGTTFDDGGGEGPP